jgi:hypothetical protein
MPALRVQDVLCLSQTLDFPPTPQRAEMDALLASVAQMVEDRRFGEVADVLDNAELEVRR